MGVSVSLNLSSQLLINSLHACLQDIAMTTNIQNRKGILIAHLQLIQS